MSESRQHADLKSWTSVQDEFLRLLTSVMTFTVLATATAAGIEYVRTGVFLNFMTLATLLSILAAVAIKTGSSRVRQTASCALVFSIASLAFLQSGPFIGVGFLMVGSVLTTSIFFGVRGAMATYAGLFLVILVVAIRSLYPGCPPEWDLAPLVWMRVGVSMVVALGCISWILIAMFEHLKTGLETANSLAIREVELDKQKERIVRHAMQVERLESLRILAGGVAHDFNNSLVVIRGGIDMLEEVVPPEELELLEMMRESANTAAETARSLTTFSRQRRDKNETCFPSSVAKNMSRRARKLFDSDIEIVWEIEETPAAQIGPAPFEEVLLQLLLNAKDGSPAGGIVTVRVATKHASVQVEVSDSGEGIPEPIIDRIFEPFFTTKGEQATGLGLALVWSHMQRCGGDVHVTSNLGVGTTFTFTIPTEKAER